MKYSLVFDFSTFTKDLIAEHRKLLISAFEANIPFFEKELKKGVSSAIKTSSEYRSLVNPRGQLKLDLGLGEQAETGEGIMNPSTAMAEIIELITDDIYVMINGRKSGTDFVVAVDISILNDLNKILNSSAGRYVSHNKAGFAQEVPWIEWLLRGGSTPVVLGYHAVYKESDSSRTGYALMEKGGSFAIDPRFAGTERDNFIVNSIKKFEEEKLSLLIDKYLFKSLK